MKPLEQVIADWRGDAAVLRRNGQPRLAEILERCADEATVGAERYLVWLTEAEARLRSKKSRAWLRERFPAWQEQGDARKVGNIREYRMVVIPYLPSIEQARQQGADQGRKAS